MRLASGVIATLAALGVVACSDNASAPDPNLWLAEAACSGRYLVLGGVKGDCGGPYDRDACILEELERFAGPVCGLVAARLALCDTKRAVTCTPEGAIVDITGVDCAAEVADYYACVKAREAGRKTPWPVGGDADGGTRDSGLPGDAALGDGGR